MLYANYYTSAKHFFTSSARQYPRRCFLFTLFILTIPFVVYSQVPIFPEAEGYARFTTGGRGGTIIRVTNLNSSGPGSLTDAIKANGVRTVVFEISGTIDIGNSVTISNPFITIAGQSAPSPGILIKGGVIVKTNDVLIQHIRIRSGLNGDDGFKFGAGNSENIYNVYLDHVSVSWGEDETMSVFQNNNGLVHDISIDHCIISEGLAENNTYNGAKGFLINKGKTPNNEIIGPFSITNTLFAHNNQRNPMLNNGTHMIFANNVVYGYRHTGFSVQGSSGEAMVAAINNVFKTRVQTIRDPLYGYTANGQVYLEGNELDGNVPSDQNTLSDGLGSLLVSSNPLALNGVTIMSTSQVEEYVVDNAGARPIDRDPVDDRIMNEVRTRTGDWMDQTEVNAAYPTLAVNSRAFVISNPNDDDDNDGYTNLEELLYQQKLEVEGRAGGQTNTAPTISDISNQSIDQGETLGPVSFTIDDAETSASSLTLTAGSNNTTLVPNNAITFGGSNSNRTVTVTPASGQSGTSTITVTVSDGELQNSETFVLTVNQVSGNTAPTISDISNQSMDQGETLGPVSFTIDDAETALNSLTLTGGSSNTSLVANNAITFGGNGSNGTVTITPVSGEFGTATITLTVSDGDLQDSETFVLTVIQVSANTAPTIGDISNQIIDQDQTMGPESFTIGDSETASNSLALTAVCNNTSLVPNGAIVFGGNGSNKTITVTPASGEFGTANITVTVSDGDLQDSEIFDLTVKEVSSNTAPVIGDISNQIIDQDQTMGPVSFTIDDTETALNSLSLSVASSNTSLVPNSAILLGGSGSNRTVTVTPIAGEFGSATITLTVSDGDLQDSEIFVLTVNEVTNNTVPTISIISGQTIDQDQTMGPVSFTINDAETASNLLTITSQSSNTSLVPNSAIVFGGSGPNRTVTITPTTGQSGIANITITVFDGEDQSSTSFELSVNSTSSGNLAPTISDISNQSINQDETTGPVSFTINDLETASNSLSVSTASGNTSLVPNNGIVLGGNGSDRTVTVTPMSGEFGSVTITVTVSDGDLQVSDTFVLTVSEVSNNTAPNISDISNQSIYQDQTMGPVSFTIDDAETAATSLTLTLGSSNSSLVPNSAISTGGSSSNRTLTITPVSGEFGTATITVTVSDGELQDSETFVLTVNEVLGNTAPTISDISNQTIDQDQTMGAVSFTVGDAETATSDLIVAATSSNQSLIINASVTIGGSDANRTVTITPVTGMFGSADITINVSDGQASTNKVFTLTVVETAVPEMTFSITVENADCQDENGSIELSVDGGVPPYTFKWLDGPEIANRTNLSSGTYTVTVTGVNSSVRTASFVVNKSEEPEIPSIIQIGDVLQATAAVLYEWSLNDEAIAGAASQTYTATESGVYTVTVFDSMNCSASSDPVTVTIADTDIIGLQLYPVPVASNLNVEMDLRVNADVDIAISSHHGRNVFQGEYVKTSGNKFSTKIDMTQLSPGIYVFQIKANKEIVRRRIIKLQ